MPDVEIGHLRKQFGDTLVLDDVDFTIRDGEFFTLLGPSGCGKSTTLNCLAGLETPTSGRIAVGDRIFFDADSSTLVETEERGLGMVFQSYALWPHKTVAQNLELPLAVRRVGAAEKKRLIEEALEKVGLAHLSRRYPHELSGGQQQRVALARALVYEPSVLLLDEPLSNLDAKLREQARAWLKRIQKDVGITTVYVTHDQDEALALSDRIAVMSSGRVLQIDTPHEIYENPASAEVAAFVGRCNFLAGVLWRRSGAEGEVVLDGGARLSVPSDIEAAEGSEVTVAVRPERLQIVPVGQGDLQGEVVVSSYVGSRYEYDVRVGDHLVQVFSEHAGLEGRLGLAVKTDAARIFAGTEYVSREFAELVAAG